MLSSLSIVQFVSTKSMRTDRTIWQHFFHEHQQLVSTLVIDAQFQQLNLSIVVCLDSIVDHFSEFFPVFRLNIGSGAKFSNNGNSSDDDDRVFVVLSIRVVVSKPLVYFGSRNIYLLFSQFTRDGFTQHKDGSCSTGESE